MQILPAALVSTSSVATLSVATLTLSLLLASLAAQEATTRPSAGGGSESREAREAREGRRGAPGARQKPIALKVGTLHPVSGPPIKNGVLVMQGATIQAVGEATSVTIPEGALVIEYPEGHAYPGLIDAMTTLYVDAALHQDAGTDAGSDLRSGLDPYDKNVAAVVASGVTTAYVTTRSPATWRGQGVLLRPHDQRIEPFRGTAQRGGDRGADRGGDRGSSGGAASRGQAGTGGQAGIEGAVQMRLSGGQGHALDRLKALQSVGEAFDQLEAYEKSFKDWNKTHDEYRKKYDEYLAWHRGRAGTGGESRPTSGAGDSRPTGTGESRPTGTGTESRPQPGARDGARDGGDPASRPPRGGGRQRPPGTGGPGTESRPAPGGNPNVPGNAQASQPTGGPGSQTPGASPGANPSPGGAGPQKPAYVKEPTRDPAKEALLKVQRGEATLRIEAQRPEEVRAALKLAKDKKLKRVVLEGVQEASGLAQEIAAAGIPVVLQGLAETDDDATKPPRERLAAKLREAGVTLAIGSGSAQAARFLPLIAAQAVGLGLEEAQALRAITLGAAEVLGIARTVGSLERGKLADVVVTSGPLLESSSRTLRVFSAGQDLYEAK